MTNVKIIPQNTEKTNIENMIFGIGTLNESANNVPPMGVKSKGVKHAIPQTPNLFHIFTAKRLLFENNLGFVFLYFLIKIRTSKPIKHTTTTIVIIPIIEHKAVSIQDKSRSKPAIGPLKNLMAVAKITVKYLPNGMILEL